MSTNARQNAAAVVRMRTADRLRRPEKRTIHRVTLEDAVEASKLFEELMGDEVEPRRTFIEGHARYVSNLDV